MGSWRLGKCDILCTKFTHFLTFYTIYLLLDTNSGIEAEAVMMGLPMSMVLPQVVGYRLTGEVNQYVTSTDVVLTITKVSK